MTFEYYPDILTALCLWREARSTDNAARTGILHVILNRAKSKFRGSDPISVILWPMQFSSFNSNDRNSSLLPDPKNPADWKAFEQCCLVVDAPGNDPTFGAVMYHSYPIGSPDWPVWAVESKHTATIGPFKFYST